MSGSIDNSGNKSTTYGGVTFISSGSGTMNASSGAPNSPSPVPFTGTYPNSQLPLVRDYVSRRHLEQSLQDQLANCQNLRHQVHIVVIYGLAGGGKSQLALNYLDKSRDLYRVVLRFDASSKAKLERGFIEAYMLIYPQRDHGAKLPSFEHARIHVLDWFGSEATGSDNRRALWIIDGADIVGHQPSAVCEDIASYMPQKGRVDIIITTRYTSLTAWSSHNSVQVGVMTEDDATLLFKKNANLLDATEEIEQDVQKIVKELGYLPLAVALAGVYVAADTSDVHRYLSRYQSDPDLLLRQDPPQSLHYDHSLLDTCNSSLHALSRKSHVAAQLLILLAFMNRDDLSVHLFEKALQRHHVSGNQRLQKLLFPGSTQTYIDVSFAFENIRCLSLIVTQEEQGTHLMHPLVQMWAQNRLTIGQRRKWSLAALELISQVIEENVWTSQVGTAMASHIMTAFTAMVQACEPKHSTTNAEYKFDKVDRCVMMHLAHALQRLGCYDHANKVQKYLCDATRRLLDPRSWETLQARHDEIGTLMAHGKHQDALNLARSSFRKINKLLGRGDRLTLLSTARLGLAWHNRGDDQRAEEILQYALNRQMEEPHKRDPDKYLTMSALSATLMTLGQYSRAEHLCRTVIQFRERNPGPEDPLTLQSKYRLADILRASDRFLEAQTTCLETLQMQIRVCGPKHPDTLLSYSLLAYLLGRGEAPEYERAKTIFEDTIEAQRTQLGDEHSSTLSSQHAYALILRLHGEYDKAIEIWEKITGPTRRTLGDNDHLWVQVEKNLNEVLSPIWQAPSQTLVDDVCIHHAVSMV